MLFFKTESGEFCLETEMVFQIEINVEVCEIGFRLTE